MQYFKYYQILSFVCTIIFPVWPSGIEQIPGIDTSMTIKYHQWKSRYIRRSVQQLFLRQDSS